MKIVVLVTFFRFLTLSKQIEILSKKHSIHNSSFDSINEEDLNDVDWCILNCKMPKETHIACIHKGYCELPNPPCRIVNFDEDKMLNIHNELRNYFATGQEPKMKGLLVADMMALEWDYDLAFLASCNLKTCAHKMQYDYCHTTTNFDTASQNIASALGVVDCVMKSYDFVRIWYSKINYLNISDLTAMKNNFQMKPDYQHFTQLVWSRSSHVGCAAITKNTNGEIECRLTCNYAPAGNILGSYVFKTGKPSSLCPSHFEAHPSLTGLCVEHENIMFSRGRVTKMALLVIVLFPTVLFTCN